MDSEAIARDDIIEDCSEGEDDAITRDASRKSLASTAPGVAGRFESYLGGRQPDSQQAELTEQDGDASLDATLDPESNKLLHAEVDADAETLLDPSLLEDVHFHDDGTLTGGPAMAEEEEEEETPASPQPADRKSFLRQPRTAAEFVEEAHGAGDAAEESDGGSDADEADAAEEALPDEHWTNRPKAERELWERVRPRALRREALRVRSLKFPKSTMDRLMRIHPEMQTKSSEALEIVNCATVLLLQALAQSTVRGRKAAGQTVRLDDVKQVCSNHQELSFMQPLSATLDASTLSAVSRQDDPEEGANNRTAGATLVTAAAPGQSTLSSAVFARTTAEPVETELANEGEEYDVVTVQGNLEKKGKTPQEKQGSKRKLPQSGKKTANKAARQAPPDEEKVVADAKSAAGGFANLFKRAESA